MTKSIRQAAALTLALALTLVPVPVPARTQSTAPDPAVWGAYAQLVGHTWRGHRVVSVDWAPDRTAMVERWAASGSGSERVVTIRPAATPGKLLATQTWNGKNTEYGGKVKRDGAVSFVAKGLLSTGMDFTVHMEGPGVAVFHGDATGLHDMRAYSGQSAGNATAATWGKYLDMVGSAWLIRDGRGRVLVRMEWRVPGQVLVERFDALDSDASFAQDIRVAPDGKGLIAETHPPYKRVGYGQVQTDGRVEFKTRSVFALGQGWSISEEDGRLRYRYDSLIEAAADSFCEKVDPAQVQVLLAQADAARRQREVAKREEKRAANDRFLAAMGTIGTGLQQASEVAAASEARSRAELDGTLAAAAAQAERERAGQQGAADAQRQREIANARAATQRQYDEAQRLEAARHASEQRHAAASAGTSGTSAAAPAGGSASILDDANTCVSRPVVGPNDSCRKGTSAVVTNQCAAAVDVRMCTRTASGWDCSATYGLAPGRTWSQAWCLGTSDIFSDARNSSSSRPLASP